MDVRFAALGRAVLCQPELAVGIRVEARLFHECLALPEARARMRAFLAAGGQTRELESRFGIECG